MPLVRISTRRHVPIDPVQTRLGIGQYFIDHAAGVPFADAAAARRGLGARLPLSPDLPTPDPYMNAAPRTHWDADAAPIHLPMRKRWSLLLPAIAIAVLFVVVCISILLTGGTAMIPSAH